MKPIKNTIQYNFPTSLLKFLPALNFSSRYQPAIKNGGGGNRLTVAGGLINDINKIK